MTDFLNNLKKFTPEVLTPKAQTDQIVSTPESMLQTNIARERGNDLATNNQVLMDSTTMTPFDFQAKYGEDVARNIDQLNVSRNEINRLENSSRDPSARLGDAAINVGSGLLGSVGGIGALGAGIVSPEAGVAVSGAISDIRNFGQSFQSDEQQRARRLDSIRADLDKQDNNNQYAEDAKKDGSFIAGLKSVGRDALSGVNRLLEDPTNLETGISEGVGSLLAAGPVGKGISVVSRLGTEAATVASIASMEAGGAYTQAVDQVMKMTPEALAANSPEYLDMFNKGMTHQEAVTNLANDAGKIAALIQAPIAAATGKLVAKFEADPLAARSLGSSFGNIGKEFVEEGVQSASGEFAGNVGIQQTADENQSLIENVGSSTIQGAIFGAGTAGAIQGPAIVGNTAVAATNAAVVKPVQALATSIKERAAQVEASNEADSGVSEQTLTEGFQEASANTDTFVEAAQTMAADKPSLDPEEVSAKVRSVTTLTRDDIISAGPGMINIMRNQGVEDPTNRMEVVLAAAKTAANPEIEQSERITAGLFLMDQIEKQQRFLEEDLPNITNNVNQESDEYQAFEQYSKLLNTLPNIPTVTEALNWARDSMTSAENESVENTVNIARINPAKINPIAAQEVLRQSDEGTIELDPAQKEAIRNSVSLSQAGQIYADIMNNQESQVDHEYVPELSPLDMVGNQIEDTGGAKSYQFSMTQHVKRINAAPDDKTKRRRVQDLRRFALHMGHKLNALNKSIKTGNKEVYQTLGADHEWVKPSDYYSVIAYSNKEGSLAFGRKVNAEAQAIAALANSIIAQNPQLGMEPVKIPPLDPLFLAPAVAKKGSKNADTRTAAQRTEDEVNASREAVEQAPTTTNEAPIEEATQVEQEPAETVVPPTSVDTASNPQEKVKAPTSEELTEDNSSVIEDEIAEQESKKARRSQSDEGRPLASEPLTLTEDNNNEASPEAITEANSSVISETSAPEILGEDSTPGPIAGKGQSLKERFASLIAADGKENMFLRTFKFSQKNTSKLMEMDNPLEDLRKEVLSKGGPYRVDVDQREVWGKLLEVADATVKAVNKETIRVLTKKKDNKPSVLELFKSGKEVYRFKEYLAFNLLEMKNEGKSIGYNKQLIETAAIAGMHWIINAHSTGYNQSKEEIADYTGVDVSEITDDLFARFNEGISLDQAKQGLGKVIAEFWGVDSVKDANSTYSKGIVEGLAADIMKGLQSEGFLQFDVIQDIPNKTYNRVLLNERSDAIKEALKVIAPTATLLSDMNLSNPTKEGWFIGTPSQSLPERQLRSAMVPLSKQERKVIEIAQNTPYYLNSMMADFIGAMDPKFFMNLMGGLDVDLDGLNVNHRKSVEGKNRSLVASWENIQQHIARLKGHPEASKYNNIEDLPSYYEFGVSRVGRLQMSGLNNPQGDKLAREIFMPTKVTLDMRDPFGSDARAFWMTIAQGLGIKTEKLYRDEVIEKAQTLVGEDGPQRRAIDLIKPWMSGTKEGSFSPELQSALLDLKGISMHGVHSLMAVAKYENALESNQGLAEFTHFNYLEADGKTNGPINSLMLLATGPFTANWLNLVSKGGAFIGSGRKTLNQHVKSSKENAKDLYETVADAAMVNQKNLRESLSGPVLDQFNAFQRMVSSLNKEITLIADDNGNYSLQMSRGVSKNPLTISIYGSGKDGIAGKAMNEIVDSIYEKISTYLSEDRNVNFGEFIDYPDNKFREDLEALVNTVPKRGRDNEIYLKRNGATQGNRKDLKNFTLSPSEKANLKDNVRMFLVNSLADAINSEVMGSVSETTSILQKATQVQSIVLAGIFRNQIIEALANRQNKPDMYPEWKKGDFLPDDELNNIREKLLPYSPYISTGTQNFMMSGSEQSNLFESVTVNVQGKDYTISMPKEFSRAMAGDLSSPAYVYGPNLAGVRGIPTLVIGTGDGQMIQNILLAGVKGLPVFDGFNLSAKDIDSGSVTINKAVLATWTTNPMRAVADSFNQFMKNDPITAVLSEDPLNAQRQIMLDNLNKVYRGSKAKDEKITNEEVTALFEELNSELTRIADDIDDRQAILKEMPLSIDQMASAESPYVQSGTFEVSADASLDQVADILNNLSRQKVDQSPDKTPVSDPSTEMQAAVLKYTSSDPSGVQVADLFGLGSIVASGKLPKGLREFADQALRLLEGTNYQVIFGTPDQLNNYEENNHPDRYTANTANGYGKIDPVTQKIYISNLAPETLVHELIHASTLTKTVAYYNNPLTLSDVDREALDRIDVLMREWIAQRESSDDTPLSEARRQALSTINGHLNAKRRGEALNEFMAWGLSNQNLIADMKKTKVRSSYAKLIGDLITNIKRLIWGDGRKGPRPGEDMFSNLRFNTRIIMSTPTPSELLITDHQSVALYQSSSFGSNQRISDLRDAFLKKVVQYTGPETQDPVGIIERAKRDSEAKLITTRYSELAYDFVSVFPMTLQESSTFTSISVAFALETNLNPNSLIRIQEMYDHVVNNLTPDDFINKDAMNQQAEAYAANEKYNFIIGSGSKKFDSKDRSSILPAFLALSMVNEEFRQILEKMEKPKLLQEKPTTIDQYLNNLGINQMNNLTVLMSGEGSKSRNVRETLDALTAHLTQEVAIQKSFIEQQAIDGFEAIDKYISTNLQNLGSKIGDIGRNTSSKVGGKLIQLAGAIISDKETSLLADGMTSFLNTSDASFTVREFAAEIIGRTDSNASVFDMISQARATVEQVRQQFREKLPQILKDKFTRKLSDREWKELFYGLAKTDLGALFSQHGLEGSLRFLTDKNLRTQEIARLEASLASEGTGRSKALISKAQQLGTYMVTGEHGPNLLRNSYAIAHMFGDKSFSKTMGTVDSLVPILDQLTTLYAVDTINDNNIDILTNLIENEKDGIKYLFSSLIGTRKDELAKNTNNVAKINHYKGFIKGENQEGVNLMVADNLEYSKLVAMGYKKIDDYEGSSADTTSGTRGYYFTPNSGRAKNNQGVIQTVHQTISGVDPKTGYTVGGVIGGRIVDPAKVQNISRSINNARPTRENLLPVYGNNGEIKAYERGVRPEMVERLDTNQNLAEMLGSWQGRQVEERVALAINEKLVDNVYEIYENGRKNKELSEFIALDKSTDPVHMEAWQLIPQNAKDHIKEVFGTKGFMVRRDMINDIVGYRQPSIGDSWTGNTRWKPGVYQEVQKFAMGIWGNDAYRYLVNTEKFIQDVVTDAKVLIVIKSVIVPVGNLISNIFQLTTNGVPIRDIITKMPAKTVELNAYINRRAKEITLKADLNAAQGTGDLIAIRKLENQIQTLKDSYKRMTIWPLIEAGEFSSISDGGINAEDLALANGKWSNLIEKITDKLPNGLQTPYRYAMLTRDTALFQALARATQYGDFLGKAIMYEDLINRKGLSKAEALAEISEEFVNYNRLSGRTMSYADSIGLTWFWKFKLRAMKVAARTLKRHPLRALLFMGMTPTVPGVGSIGSPLTDNMANVLIDGRLDSSIGPGMAYRSMSLNPWYNLFG